MKQYKYIQKIIPTIEKFVALYGGEIIPCTEQEVSELESLLPTPYILPLAYKEFLLFCGKSLGILYKRKPYMQYEDIKRRAKKGNPDALTAVRIYDPNAQLYPDILVLHIHDITYFTFMRVGEEENPPIYCWNEEDGYWNEEEEEEKVHEEALKLEAAKILCNSFTEYILFLIRTTAIFSLKDKVNKLLKLEQAPRGRQFWISLSEEKEIGITYEEIMQMVGFLGYKWLDDAASWCGKSSIEYLEELSGWKAHKIDDEVRFFPPSYESPEEKEKKALEQQNKLEEKKQELAKAEKKIANFQKRIKNLSGDKLSGIKFDNPSVAKIKELEKDLRKQKVVKQNLEREIAKLEEDVN